MKTSYNNPIVEGQVVETDDKRGLTVKLDDGRVGFVELDQISDVDIGPIKSYFQYFPKYKFKVLPKANNADGQVQLSYKLCHPKLVTNKRKIIPTCNHFNTLKKMIWFEIYLYDKSNNINELSTKKLNSNLDDIQLVRKDDDEE